MNNPNENGVYEAQVTLEVARFGRSGASITLAQCNDGLFRFATHVHYSYGGFTGPISNSSVGFTSQREAEDAALAELLLRFPKAYASEPASVHSELSSLRALVEQSHRQLSLF